MKRLLQLAGFILALGVTVEHEGIELLPKAHAMSCVAREHLEMQASVFIARCREGGIHSVFPGELLKETLGTIKNSDSAAHRTAWKLLNDNRFKKEKRKGPRRKR